MAELCADTKDYQGGINLCLSVIGSVSDEKVLCSAYNQARGIYISMHNKPAAIALLREKEQKLSSTKLKARAAFEIGVLYKDSGQSEWPHATRELQRVIDTYPSDECATHAKRVLEEMKHRLMTN